MTINGALYALLYFVPVHNRYTTLIYFILFFFVFSQTEFVQLMRVHFGCLNIDNNRSRARISYTKRLCKCHLRLTTELTGACNEHMFCPLMKTPR